MREEQEQAGVLIKEMPALRNNGGHRIHQCQCLNDKRLQLNKVRGWREGDDEKIQETKKQLRGGWALRPTFISARRASLYMRLR